MFRYAALLLLLAITSAPGTLLWEARPGGRDFGGLAESAGILTAGNITSQGGIFAFSSDSGKVLWSHRGEQLRGGTASDAQRVFAVFDASTGNRLAAFDLKAGKQLWTTATDGKLGGDFPPIVDSGRVYLMNRDGFLDAYDAATGNRLYRFAYAPEDPECPSGQALANNRLFFGGGQHDGSHSPGKFLWAINPTTGKELWKYQTHLIASYISECFSTPAVSSDTVVVTSSNSIFALCASTGVLLWSRKSEGVSGGYPKPYPLSAPTIVNGVVYAARNGAIDSWNLSDGKPLPSFPVELGSDAVRAHLYASGNTLFFIGNIASDTDKPDRHPLHAMDTLTHKILWTHRVNREVRYIEDWTTDEILVTQTAVYYENNSLIAKVAR
jgi:outer membrane protein assembly factor BamB